MSQKSSRKKSPQYFVYLLSLFRPQLSSSWDYWTDILRLKRFRSVENRKKTKYVCIYCDKFSQKFGKMARSVVKCSMIEKWCFKPNLGCKNLFEARSLWYRHPNGVSRIFRSFLTMLSRNFAIRHFLKFFVYRQVPNQINATFL